MFSQVIDHKAVEIKTQDAELLRGPGVYMFMRDDEALYIGATKNLMWRSMRADHDASDARKQSTSIIYLPCKTHQAALELERKLIFDLRPKHNHNGVIVEATRRTQLSRGVINQYV